MLLHFSDLSVVAILGTVGQASVLVVFPRMGD